MATATRRWHKPPKRPVINKAKLLKAESPVIQFWNGLPKSEQVKIIRRAIYRHFQAQGGR